MTDRALFERLIAASAPVPRGLEAIGAQLGRQTLYEREPDSSGLNALAGLLHRRVTAGGIGLEESIGELERSFPRQPLVRFYAFALRREAGDDAAARASLDALLALDADDPIALALDAHLRGEAIPPASAEQRLANIARFAGTPLLSNPYSIAVGVLFESIREQRSARVLDIGVGSGAQMEGLLEMLGREPHSVRRLELVGLDHNPAFLARAGDRIAAAARRLGGAVEVAYEPVEGSVQSLDDVGVGVIAGGGLDAANASIALHEVPGEAKIAALQSLRRTAPRRLVLAEWDYFLENVLAPTSTEFLFNVRQVGAAMVAALRYGGPLEEARAVVRDWLSQGEGQLTCPSERRQECFLPVTGWRALLDHTGFEVLGAEPAWPAAAEPAYARVAPAGWYVQTSDYAGASPIALLVAAPV